MANMYNDYITFLSKRILKKDLIPFETDTLSEYVNSKIPVGQSGFNKSFLQEDEVLKLPLTLKINKSSGTDYLGPRIIKLYQLQLTTRSLQT